VSREIDTAADRLQSALWAQAAGGRSPGYPRDCRSRGPSLFTEVRGFVSDGPQVQEGGAYETGICAWSLFGSGYVLGHRDQYRGGRPADL